MTTLAGRLASIDAEIVDAARSAGRDPGAITRIVVTKFHPVSLVEELSRLGVADIGENRQQELTQKRSELSRSSDLRWHFIGQLQSKKAAAVRAASDVVHSVDRAKVAIELDRAAHDDSILDVFVQVNLTDDPARGGAAPADVMSVAEKVAELPSLRLLGVMAVAPLDQPAAPAFERLAGFSADVQQIEPTATRISAGMSADLAEAIAFGATHLRIGSAITGPRPSRV